MKKKIVTYANDTQVAKRWSLIALLVISGKRGGGVEYHDLSVIIYW